MPIRDIEFSEGSDKVRVDLDSTWTDIGHNWRLRPESNPEVRLHYNVSWHIYCM